MSLIEGSPQNPADITELNGALPSPARATAEQVFPMSRAPSMLQMRSMGVHQQQSCRAQGVSRVQYEPRMRAGAKTWSPGA